MVFNLAKLNADNIIIANTDESFNGSELSEQDFSVTVKRLSRAEKIDVSAAALSEDGKISQGEYSKALFINSIVEVDGFKNEDGVEISINESVRELIWEYAPDLLVEKIKDAIESYKITDEKKSETSTDTQLGQ